MGSYGSQITGMSTANGGPMPSVRDGVAPRLESHEPRAQRLSHPGDEVSDRSTSLGHLPA